MPEADTQSDRGRNAVRPTQIPKAGWKDVLLRVKAQIGEDRVPLVAAGVSFYLLLAIFPALAALVSVYGLFANPETIQAQLQTIEPFVPADVMSLLREQLQSLAGQATSALSFGFISGLLISLWSANKGIRTIFQAMNIAYDEEESRGFVKLTLISLASTLGVILFLALVIFVLAVLPAMMAVVGLGQQTATLVNWLRWPLLLVVAAFACALIYRYGASRDPPQWRWVAWGSALVVVVWLAASMLFSWYLANFADYNATYGSLGAVVGLMMWLWLSSFILLAGAELNSEMEHQTRRDTTQGDWAPMGERGARKADTLGEAVGQKSS